MVFDDEAYEGERRDVDVELEVFVPRWVEAFSTGEGGVKLFPTIPVCANIDSCATPEYI